MTINLQPAICKTVLWSKIVNCHTQNAALETQNVIEDAGRDLIGQIW